MRLFVTPLAGRRIRRRLFVSATRMFAFVAAPALVLAAIADASAQSGDAARGAGAFRTCAACHSVKPGEHMTGPSLAQVWGRTAGTVEGFTRYSDALKNSGVTWTEQTLAKWLADPAAFIPGNAMGFPGVKDAGTRRNIIAYLKAASEGKAPAAGGRGGGMTGGGMMGRGKLNLKKAPPEGQVVAIDHCRDTYTVRTADGKTTKVWEFNLRFKTDSSADGPTPGRPVIVGAGMQGDRASVVFSAPQEISGFVKPSCP